jgi:hypothetical protein
MVKINKSRFRNKKDVIDNYISYRNLKDIEENKIYSDLLDNTRLKKSEDFIKLMHK